MIRNQLTITYDKKVIFTIFPDKPPEIVTKEPAKVVPANFTKNNRLTFEEHFNHPCRVTNFKLHAFLRIRKYLTQEKAIGDIFRTPSNI